jgi:hypothetical protein
VLANHFRGSHRCGDIVDRKHEGGGSFGACRQQQV